MTVSTWRNLWFHSGDSLRCDEDGWYYFAGRLKDYIRCRGHNVSALEVETALSRHDDVVEVAAVGAKADGDASEDEILVAVVLAEGTDTTEEELIRFVEPDLPYFAVPRFVARVDELPKNASGKLMKASLVDETRPGAWDRVAAGVRLSEELRLDEVRRKRVR
jgi:crotonobetaine/carnitine-CoA ligase